MKTRLVHLGIISFWFASFFASISPAFAQNWRPLSPDIDGDGLSNETELNGWCNAAGCFTTDPLDADSDHDGLTDGEEKLFDTNPLDDHSPGIYVEYQDSFQTQKYLSLAAFREQVHRAPHSRPRCRHCAPRVDLLCGRPRQRHAHDQQKHPHL